MVSGKPLFSNFSFYYRKQAGLYCESCKLPWVDKFLFNISLFLNISGYISD